MVPPYFIDSKKSMHSIVFNATKRVGLEPLQRRIHIGIFRKLSPLFSSLIKILTDITTSLSSIYLIISQSKNLYKIFKRIY